MSSLKVRGMHKQNQRSVYHKWSAKWLQTGEGAWITFTSKKVRGGSHYQHITPYDSSSGHFVHFGLENTGVLILLAANRRESGSINNPVDDFVYFSRWIADKRPFHLRDRNKAHLELSLLYMYYMRYIPFQDSVGFIISTREI